MGLVIDTSVLLAALNENDDANARCVALLETTREQLVVPSPVLNELDYWLAKIATVDAWLALCEDIEVGRYELHPLGPRDVLRAAQLQAKYADLPLGFVDAAVFVTCMDRNESKVATLDRRHFSILRSDDGRGLRILPENGSGA